MMTPLEQMTHDQTFATCNRERICNCKQCAFDDGCSLRWFEFMLLPIAIVLLLVNGLFAHVLEYFERG